MSTKYSRRAIETAIKNKNKDQICALLQRDDAKSLLLNKDDIGRLPIHDACIHELGTSSFLQLIIDASVEQGIAKEMLEENDTYGATCLHLACDNKLSTDSLRLLLEYLTKHTDIKKVLEKKDNNGWTCLHFACFGKFPTQSLGILLCYLTKHADFERMLEEQDVTGWTCLHLACWKDLSPDSLRLLISFFHSKNLLATRLDAKNNKNETPIDHAKNGEIKQLLQEPDCFEKCRLWLLRNHEDTFFYSLYPNSFDQTCQALKELPKSALQHSQQHATIMLIALMSSPSKFRDAINKTDSSAPMSSYFDVVKKGDKKSDYKHWTKNFHLFREIYGQWPPSERKTASTYEGEGSSSCSIQ